MMKPCVVVCDNALGRELLEDRAEQTYNMLKDFFFGLFGNCLTFETYDVSLRYRHLLLPLFSGEAQANYEGAMDDLVDFAFDERLGRSAPVNMEVYEEFKRLSLAFNLRIFLDINERQTPELFESISRLVTTHWHGIISVPLNVKMPMVLSSGYRYVRTGN